MSPSPCSICQVLNVCCARVGCAHECKNTGAVLLRRFDQRLDRVAAHQGIDGRDVDAEARHFAPRRSACCRRTSGRKPPAVTGTSPRLPSAMTISPSCFAASNGLGERPISRRAEPFEASQLQFHADAFCADSRDHCLQCSATATAATSAGLLPVDPKAFARS